MSSGSFLAAPSTTARDCRWRPTDPAVVDGARVRRISGSASRSIGLVRIAPNAAIRSAAAPFTCSGTSGRALNWSAPNTSYVERDSENRLRGFDDRATTLQTHDASGRPMWTVRRDYRDLVPLLRHRHEPDHPGVVALRRSAHDVRLTIDAGFPVSREPRLWRATPGSPAGRAAAIVLDPDTGELLASASYPWPDVDAPDGDADTAKRGGCAARSRAIRALSAGLDVQAGDGRRGASPAAGSRHDHVRLRAAAGRPGRRQDQRLESADPRRRARHASARHDRHARRPGAFLQRLLRAAGGQRSARSRSSTRRRGSGSR